MSKNLIDQIEDAIYNESCEAHDNGEPEPTFRIVFSPEGYNRARYEKMTSVFFNYPTHCANDTNTFAGYPYEVNVVQEETFKIMVEDR